MNNNSKIFIYIELHNCDLSQEEISKLWKDGDVYFSMKGDTFFEFAKGEKLKKTRETNYCNIRYEFSQTDSPLNDILLSFIMAQKDNINYISEICSKTSKRVHICIYPDSEQYTFNISSQLLKILLELKLEIGTTVLYLE